MLRELMLAALIMATGLTIAGMVTHLYQGFLKTEATIRYDGKTYLHTLGHLAMSFVCGPYIMLQMGWKADRNGTLSLTLALFAAFVGFGWAFITGLIFVGGYFAVVA